MTKTCVGVLLAVASLGCSSDSPPGASVAKDVTFLDSPLAQIQNVSLIRAGDSFTLAGYENGQVRWGRLSLDGVLTQETSFLLTQPLLGPFFAATKRTNPGDQLAAIVVTDSATIPSGYDLSAIVQTLGDSTAAAPVVLDTLPVGTDLSTVQIAAGAATSGNVGFVAWGIRVRGISPNYLLLPADAVTTATPSKMFPDPDPANVPAWDCLQTTNGRTGLGFSVITPNQYLPQNSDFQGYEVDESGGAAAMTYQLTVAVANCRIVGSPTPEGNFFMAFQSTTAIDFATYYPPRDPTQDGTVTTYDPVLPAANFGDPLSIPRPAWVNSAGGDVVIGLSRTAGPEVVRFTYNAVPHGATLPLRSEKGQTGPVAAWVGPSAVYVTYADQAKGSGSTPSVKRYFMRIESPAPLP
jgi:hypothetical protein